MHVSKSVLLLIIIAIASTAPAISRSDDVKVVPDEEQKIAQRLGVSGPTETHGIESSLGLGSVSLGEDFEALRGRMLRARRVTVLPGGTVGVHQHTSRPGVLYMLQGELTEFRNDHDGPLVRKQGDTSFEKDGVIHWWRNDSAENAVALVVDIVSEATE